MGGSPRSVYLGWYNRQCGNWATWEPGDPVEPGDVGRFDSEGCFKRSRTLRGYGIPFDTEERKRFGAVLLSSDDDVDVEAKLSGKTSAAFAFLGKAEAGKKFTAKRQHACVLHMRDISEGSIRDPERALQALHGALQNRQWPVDQVVVIQRFKVQHGFAAIFLEAGRSFEIKAAGEINIVDVADLENIDFDLAAGRERTGVQHYEFVPDATPAFSRAIWVRRGLWDKLLPWRRDRGVLIGPDGSRYTGPPEDLSKYLPEDLLYDPERSAMSPDELAAMSVEDLFEEVHTLPAAINRDRQPAQEPVARVLTFPLRVPQAPAALAAADPERDPAPVRTSSPDGQANVFLYRRDDKYWLEVTLAPEAATPAVVSVRYELAAGGQQELLIPVEGAGGRVPSSMAELAGFAGGQAESDAPVPPYAIGNWPAEVVTASLRAAATASTMRAWAELIPVLPADLGLLVRQVTAENR